MDGCYQRERRISIVYEGVVYGMYSKLLGMIERK